jgi:hypothetical protein
MSELRRYNSLKKRALAAFRGRAWLNPPAWSVLAGFRPSRSAWSYLLRLHRFGLLQRRRDARGLLLYRISLRGERRLRWLERNR